MPHLNYIEPLFRPPSEAHSLILQITNGCSWNHCRFCEMYTEPQKKFKPKTHQDIVKDLKKVHSQTETIRRIFLADGDAMVLSFKRLKAILLAIKTYFPVIQRIAAYCLPRNIKNKTIDELAELCELGLSLLYIGCESGHDELLNIIDKGETYDSSLHALLKIKAAGIKSSVMILNGLGGIRLSEAHALQSANLINEAQPTYLATLVVTFPMGMKRFQEGFNHPFKMLDQQQLFQEMEIFIQTLSLEKTIFRSDHASNYLILKGILNKDKLRLLKQIHQAIHQPETINLRPEWQRSL